MSTGQGAPKLDLIIAARNEESYIGGCLQSLLDQDAKTFTLQVFVAVNASTDKTTEVALTYKEKFQARGWALNVLDVPVAGKVNALNAADQVSSGGIRVYLDADVRLKAELLRQLHAALDTDVPLYATGTLQVAPAQSWVTRQYASLWTQLPFVKGGAVGAGLFAVNSAGRARWAEFPNIISDDTFVRLCFRPDERIEVPACYIWPMIEGLRNLIRVRRRQDAGVEEIAQNYPDMLKNEGKATLGKGELLRLLLKNPVGFCVYAVVHVAVRLRPASKEWTRGR